MAKRPKKTGQSKLMRDKQRLEQSKGVLTNDGRDWTQLDTDTLLDMYFEGRGLQTIALKLQRPVKTVENKVWKVATGYGKDRRYQPMYRNDPKPTQTQKLSRREVKVLELGLFGAGQQITEDRLMTVDAEHLARVINRPLAVVQRYVSFKKPHMEGFL